MAEGDDDIPLFRRFPELRGRLPRIGLGEYPTPVERLHGVESRSAGVYVKRDDVSAELYGGNKVRKLEFTLADAVRKGATEVVTAGYAGSNHALATALYGQRLGLKCTSLLLEQPPTPYAARTIRRAVAAGAELHHYGDISSAMTALAALVAGRTLTAGRPPYIVPPGGSSPLGNLGYVNAALELAEQIDRGEMPEPQCVYVPLGTMGTAVGLAIGFRLARLGTRVEAIRIAPERWTNAWLLGRLYRKTVALLRKHVPSIPALELGPCELEIRGEFLGHGYAVFTPDGERAIETVRNAGGPQLDGTYTAKAAAALFADIDAGACPGVSLLWDTYSSRELAVPDSVQLPRGFERYA